MPVQNLLLLVYPEPGQLGEDADHLVGLEVVDEDVGDPQRVDELQTHGFHVQLRGVV